MNYIETSFEPWNGNAFLIVCVNMFVIVIVDKEF